MFYNDKRIGMVQGDLHKADDEDGSWITMNGTHVHMKDGEVDKGPQSVKDHVAGKNQEKAKAAQPAFPMLSEQAKESEWKATVVKATLSRKMSTRDIERDIGTRVPIAQMTAEMKQEIANHLKDNAAIYWKEYNGVLNGTIRSNFGSDRVFRDFARARDTWNRFVNISGAKSK
jgi:hypothetical protein